MTTFPTSAQPADGLAAKLKRTELQHSNSSIPGRDIVQVLTEIPAGVESGWHTHPGEEVGYILAGEGFAHVGGESFGPVSDRRRGFIGPLLIATDYGHARARFHERLRDRAADSTRAARNECIPPTQVDLHQATI